MRRKLGGILFLFLGFVSICPPAFAHHGNSAYDETTPVAIKGTVTEFAWGILTCRSTWTPKMIRAKSHDGR